LFDGSFVSLFVDSFVVSFFGLFVGSFVESQTNVLKANAIFFSTEHTYKDDNYHSLKPDSHKKREKWRKYDMDKYREAYSPETLENVPTFKYDNKLYDFVDPT
jgi:hypothetical protein